MFPIIYIATVPIWLPIYLTCKALCSMAVAVIDYTPFADWFFKALHFGLYDLTWWPRKVVWKLFYALDSMLLPNFVTA